MLRARATTTTRRRPPSAWPCVRTTEGLVDVAYSTVDTPLGAMLVASTERGLVRVGLPRETFDDVLEDLAAQFARGCSRCRARVDAARRELEEYFAGSRREFDLPLDLRLIRSTFRCRVLESMIARPLRGGDHLRGGGGASRQPARPPRRGLGPGLEPDPVVIPCHRVVRTGGAVGNYGGGPEMKRYLLRHEGWLSG